VLLCRILWDISHIKVGQAKGSGKGKHCVRPLPLVACQVTWMWAGWGGALRCGSKCGCGCAGGEGGCGTWRWQLIIQHLTEAVCLSHKHNAPGSQAQSSEAKRTELN